ncbi:MAG: hypothetical protein RIG62_09880 [Cyclobacteriaceae bacterium]
MPIWSVHGWRSDTLACRKLPSTKDKVTITIGLYLRYKLTGKMELLTQDAADEHNEVMQGIWQCR